jgi:beta-glucanase (GH16 family)
MITTLHPPGAMSIGWGNNELEFYTSHRPENGHQENGSLVIRVNVEPMGYGGRQFTSIRAITAKAWTYGKFEARARLPKGKQLWPAIWMMPQNSYYGVWYVEHRHMLDFTSVQKIDI